MREIQTNGFKDTFRVFERLVHELHDVSDSVVVFVVESHVVRVVVVVNTTIDSILAKLQPIFLTDLPEEELKEELRLDSRFVEKRRKRDEKHFPGKRALLRRQTL